MFASHLCSVPKALVVFFGCLVFVFFFCFFLFKVIFQPDGKRNTARPQSKQTLQAKQLFSNQKRSEQVVWQAVVKNLKTQNHSKVV